MNNNSLIHIDRNEDIEFEKAFNQNDSISKSIIIYGDSGTGKTSIAKEYISKIIASNEKDEYLIASINLIDDDITPSVFFELLIFILWNGEIHSPEDTINISKQDSFRKFLSSKRKYKKLSKVLFYSVQTLISTIPTYGAQVSDFMGNVHTSNASFEISKTELLQKYLSKISKKKRVILLVDNYQFMLPQIRFLLESMIGSINKNLTLISIFRVGEFVEFQDPICFNRNKHKIHTKNFDEKQTLQIINNTFGISPFIERVAHDCFQKTKGNAKEIDLYIKRNKNAIKNGTLKIGNTLTLKDTLSELPDIQRFIILLSTLFPSGIKIEYIYNFINKNYIANEYDVELELGKLITLGYIVINSVNNNILKPAHDRIGVSLSKICSDEDFIEFYHSIEATLEELIIRKTNDSDYIYLLHCLIGICSFKDLQKNINFLIELIAVEYNNCSYFYVTEIISQIKEIISYLPETSVIQLLDSCQKSSEFSLGLSIYSIWKRSNKDLADKTSLYAIKFLTQLYDFDQAYSLLSEIEDSNEKLLYELNILQHQGKDALAATKIQQLLDDPMLEKDKFFYIILRNSAHLCSYKEAEYNLKECIKFFNTHGTLFERATIYNNISVIQIWNGIETYSEAKNNLKKSINIHQSIQSNEIFEPYCNLSVLLFMEGKYTDALRYANLALEELPHRLEMDVIILNINKMIIEVALGKTDLNTLYQELKNYCTKPVAFKDPWIMFQISYNLYNIEKAMDGFSTTEYSDYYIDKCHMYTGFEVLTKINIDGLDIPISLSLSPNWRY